MDISFFKKLIKKGKQAPFKQEFYFSPHHDWKIILRAFFVCGVCLIILSFYLSYKINKDEIFRFDKNNDEGLIKVNQKSLDKVLESFKANEEKVNSIKEGTFYEFDPSR